MKTSIQLLILGTLLLGFDSAAQALRIVGYEGELVFTDGHVITVSGATQADCEANFRSEQRAYETSSGERLYHGRNGTQPCVPVFIYRSPKAPSYEVHPGLVLWPELPIPPVCLSCPWLEDWKIVEQIYPDHVGEVAEYVKAFGIDQYNAELRDLQQRYEDNIKAFEHTMYQLDQSIQRK